MSNKNNVRDVKKLPAIEQTVYYFDKDGNRKEKTVKNSDRYLVVLRNGDSVVLKQAELKTYEVIFNSSVANNEQTVDEDDDLITEEDINENSNPKTVTESK